MIRNSVILCLGLLAAAQAGYDSINKDLVVTSCDRAIDMSTQLVKMSHKIVLQNNGQGAVKSFLFSVEPTLAEKVSFIEATFGSNDKTYLRVSETKVQSDMDKTFWKIELKSSLNAGASTTVNVEVVLGGALEMFPAAITQKERQLVIHGENNSPMLVVTRLERVIELSMWGNIAIEETVDVAHKGAQLKGSFSRYEYQRESSGVSSVKNFKTLLPASSKDVYYRDDIGNISTSHMRVMDDAVELDLRPRFPLFGGWKTHYVIGYNVPSYEYLFYSSDKHVLNMRLVDHIFDDMLVEEVEVKIILPEGVSDLKLSTPYPMTRGEDDKHYTYLDTTGRTVVTLYTDKTLTENHIQDFQI